MVRTLLSFPRVRIDASGYNRFTPLCVAAWRGYPLVIQELRHADLLDKRDVWGRTALSYAMRVKGWLYEKEEEKESENVEIVK